MRRGAGDRREELPAGEDGDVGPGAGGDVLLELVRCLAALECGAGVGAGAGEAGVDGGEEALGDGGLGEGEEAGGVELRRGALGLGVELADGVDLVAEEVDADGAILLGRVDVDDAAAHGDLAGHLDDIDAGVADGEQVLDEHVGQVLFAGAQGEGEAGVVVAGEEAHAGGFDGRDDEAGRDGGVAGADLPEGAGAGLLDLGVGREIFEGEDVVRGEANDLVRVECAGELGGGEDAGVEGFGGLVIGDEDEAGGAGGTDHEGQIEGARGGSEAGDTAAAAAGDEVAAEAVEGLGVFEVGEEIADKGEDHG